MKVKSFTLWSWVVLLIFPGLSLATVHTVQVVDNDFIPTNLSVNEGDTVLWVNNGSMTHTSTSGANCTSDGTWNSGNMAPNDEYMRVFSSAGNFPYFCIPHCGMGMTGEVSVQPAVGLDESATTSFEFFPNPVTDQMKLKWGDKRPQNIDFEVYDLKGSKIELPAFHYVSAHELSLNTSNLKEGAYILKFIREEEVVVRKFYKE